MNYKLMTAGIMGVLLAACGGGGKEKGVDTPDTTPDSFVLNSVTDLELGEQYITDNFTISGVNLPVAINVTGCAYSLNGGSYSVESTQVRVGDVLSFQVEAPEAYEDETVCSVSIGGYQTSFSAATKTIIARATFFYDRLTTPGSNEEQPANLMHLYTHSKGSSDYVEVDTFEGNSAFFVDSVPEAYTAVFVTEIEGEHLVVLHTSHNPTEDEQVILPERNPSRYGRIEEGEETCKTIELDRSGLSNSSYGYWLGINSPDFCDGRHSITTGSALSGEIALNVGIENNVLVTVTEQNNNVIGYDFISSDDYVDGGTHYFDVLKTDFSQIELSNPYSQKLRFYANASSGDDEVRTYSIGGFQLNESMSAGVMNVINMQADRYSAGYSRNSNSVDGKAYQRSWANSESEALPNLNLNDVGYGHFSSLSLSIANDINIEWYGLNLDVFDTAAIVFDGYLDGDIYFMWQITTPNQGSITLPHFSDTFLANFSFEYDDLYVSLTKASQDNNDRFGVWLNTGVSCDTSDCLETIDF